MDDQQQPEVAPEFLIRYRAMQEVAFLTRECGLTYAQASAMPAEDRLLLVIANARLDELVNGLLDWVESNGTTKSATILSLVRTPEAQQRDHCYDRGNNRVADAYQGVADRSSGIPGDDEGQDLSDGD